MANIKDNKKGFKVIQISRKELVEELGQYGAMGWEFVTTATKLHLQAIT